MNTRTVNGFRVRCAVEAVNRKYLIQVWTRKVGANAPEKCWPLMDVDGRAFSNQDEAEARCAMLFKGIRGVRANGEPEYSRGAA
ncbi:hypothetical protein CAL29_06490 [Bordetella genomosp. 10]|uniref:WGR domain-containing protein n=1 Tax=Bordetella genomosp. 10 TaxID=1416804 RepID=A0A261SML0_9BORD|nr:hypothetical protein [Bordetella genomosp. 10]OZI38656.1 hypothetical protein CAL29_06490 [Bordetella genomosp. 10]